ncbi:MAG: hypothetical protein K0Q55_2844 [Verrucomicrobia bacterium]|jgi:hypothetical protein|nr:hypothetical protein [Verrucomicrobiota bacterium]
MNDSGNKFSKWILVTLVALLVFFWHREYQRGAMGRYLRSESFYTLALSFPKNANALNRVNLQWDDRQMIVRVEVTNQAEFDRWLAISKRPARSNTERFILIRGGAEYHL